MACQKKKYSKIDALIALSECFTARNRYHNFNRREKRMYYCKECHAWHLTSQNKNEKDMKKLLLALVICLALPLTGYAQTYRYQASQFAYRIKNAYGNWTSWSNWQYSQIVIDIMMDKDVIIVYSDPRQVYAVYEYVGAENDRGGGRQVYYKVIDQDYDYGTVRLRIEANGNSQMYVDFNDVSWCYSGLRKIY